MLIICIACPPQQWYHSQGAKPQCNFSKLRSEEARRVEGLGGSEFDQVFNDKPQTLAQVRFRVIKFS